MLSTPREKSQKAIQDEIRSVIRQITATVTFLPLLEVSCSFDLLIYADKDLVVPEKWEESGPQFITNSEEVRLRSFTTTIHKVFVQLPVFPRKSPSVEVDPHGEATTSCEGPLLLHGHVELRRGQRRQQRHLFLFSNLLLVSNTKNKKIFKIKNKIPLNTVWTADSMGKANIGAQRSFILGWPTVNFVATLRSPELKEKWYSFLQRYISLAKEKDLPKRISLEIFTEDIKNCASPITITVTNSDTVNDTISMSPAVLGVTVINLN
ncbi:Rho Gtpase-Activating Protein 20 [Manis pentadactyla]|nr:Rho Gtpase-Activating Protein 20 [Manis pentadactyla]